MRRSDKIILQKISSEIGLGNTFLMDISKEEFMRNEIIKRAVAMVAVNVGELVKRLSDEFRANNSHIAFRDAARFRDIVAHKYDTLKMDDVYDTMINDFPEMKNQIEKILESDA